MGRVMYLLSHVQATTRACSTAVDQVKRECPICHECHLGGPACLPSVPPRKFRTEALSSSAVASHTTQLYGASFPVGRTFFWPITIGLVLFLLILLGATLLVFRTWPHTKGREVSFDMPEEMGPSSWRLRTFGTHGHLLLSHDAEGDEEMEGLVSMENNSDQMHESDPR